jgi:glutamate N-acetyltransferase/amino-acid N-acetyltransferase
MNPMATKRKLFDDWNLRLETAPSNDPSQDVVSFESRTLGREVQVEGTLVHQPEGISCAAVAAGIKHEGVLDFTVAKLDRLGAAAGIFTTSLCPSFAVQMGREALADGQAQALAVISKNANVYTPNGRQDLVSLANHLAKELGVSAGDIVLSCTGVIGVPLPMEKIEAAVAGISRKLRPAALEDAARAILTTDRAPKVCSVRFGDIVLCAMAKGAGMIEPNMATMLVYFFTNADIDGALLREILADASDRTFNSLSVDSDTSTSDSVVLFSTRRVSVGDAERADFTDAVRGMSLKLARDIVCQAEGSTKLIECTVGLHTSHHDAKIVAKNIVNSPLVKTAIHGADPNWGRLVMAIGKPDERLTLRSIAPRDVTISVMGRVLFDGGRPVDVDLPTLSKSLAESSRVAIDVRIGEPRYAATVWGCDLSRRYVEINADYTT